jgi:hypothetical protein
MDLISPVLRVDFREFCVANLVLARIDDAFVNAGVRHGQLPGDRPVSGQRRTRVEEYYSGINWRSPADVEKFLRVLEFALAQASIPAEARNGLRASCEREGLPVDGFRISRGDTAPSATAPTVQTPSREVLGELARALLDLSALDPQSRGFAFERFLKRLFEVSGMRPRAAFKLVGEQIDGSFELDSHHYLVEAKWQTEPTAANDLVVLREKVESKAAWGRGLFITWNIFSPDGLKAFARGRATNIIGMTGQDLHLVLSGETSLADAIRAKARRAAETGEFYVALFDLIRTH